MSDKLWLCSWLGLIGGLAAGSCFGEVPSRPEGKRPLAISPLFADGAVIAANRPVAVWGSGPPETRVSLSLADRSVETTIDRQGFWEATLPEIAPATSLELRVAGAGTIVLKDISVADAEPRIAAIRAGLVDADATPETVALFHNLRLYADRGRTLVGQQDPEVSAVADDGITDIYRLTGSEPAVWGSDFIHVTDRSNDGSNPWFVERERALVDLAVKAYDRGMVNAFCWHARDPVANAFYVAEISEAERTGLVSSLLPGGKNHAWYLARLGQMAAIFKRLIGADGKPVPVIFRPFHEFDGEWFWWGKPFCTAEEYRECWKFTVRHMRDTLGVHNLLYAFSPDIRFDTEEAFLERYPGDEFVDVIGFDDYYDFETGQIDAAAKRLRLVSDLARKRGKVAALTEIGYRTKPVPPDLFTGVFGKALADPALGVAYMMFWRQDHHSKPPAERICFVPTPGSPEAANFGEFVAGPRPLLLAGIRHLYDTPVLEASSFAGGGK